MREVVVQCRAELFRFARSLTRTNADAEDLAQSAALRALERSEPLRDPERAKSYLFTIVRNLATDQARRQALIVMEPRAAVPDTPSIDPLIELIARAEGWGDSHEVVTRIAPEHQAILRMRFEEELDNAAIAERLHVSEHAARQRVYRAMQALRAAVRAPRLAS